MANRIPGACEVAPASFISFVESAEFALIYVDLIRPQFSAAIIDYLKREYPGKFAFGTLRRDVAAEPIWWNKRFGPVLGPIKSGWEVPEGFYLFHNSKVVYKHSGKKERSSEEHIMSIGVQLIGIAFPASNLTQAQRNNNASEDANAFLYDIEPIIQKLIHRESSSEKTPPQRPPASEAKQEPEDPYKILGVQRDASEEQIKKAYREKISLNHPDKVAHLSEKLRKTAHEETRWLTDAYEAIINNRNGD